MTHTLKAFVLANNTSLDFVGSLTRRLLAVRAQKTVTSPACVAPVSLSALNLSLAPTQGDAVFRQETAEMYMAMASDISLPVHMLRY